MKVIVQNPPNLYHFPHRLCRLLPLFGPTLAKQAPNALQAALCSPSNRLPARYSSANNGVTALCHRTRRVGAISAAVILALSFESVDSMVRCHVTNRLCQTTLAELPCREVVHAVLDGVDLLDPGYFGLVEGI